MNAYSDYEVIAVAVAGHTALIDAAGCHGALSGMLCVNRGVQVDDWLLEVFGALDRIPSGETRELFVALFDQPRDELESFEFGFDLFLPDDEVELSVRAVALSHWCKGFLHGLGSLSKGVTCGDDAKEVLRDIYQIVDLRIDGVDDEDEEAYAELTEYLRVGVQLLRAEFQDERPPFDSAPVEHGRLH